MWFDFTCRKRSVHRDGTQTGGCQGRGKGSRGRASLTGEGVFLWWWKCSRTRQKWWWHIWEWPNCQWAVHPKMDIFYINFIPTCSCKKSSRKYLWSTLQGQLEHERHGHFLCAGVPSPFTKGWLVSRSRRQCAPKAERAGGGSTRVTPARRRCSGLWGQGQKTNKQMPKASPFCFKRWRTILLKFYIRYSTDTCFRQPSQNVI